MGVRHGREQWFGLEGVRRDHGGNIFGRIVGVVVAALNALLQLAYLPHFPLWSFTMILIDVLVIYGLVAHGGRLDEWGAESGSTWAAQRFTS
jgi:hypothetical protein